METLANQDHRVELLGRERLLVTGVEDVLRFDEEEILMDTLAGTLRVEGQGLHVDRLNLDGGELQVEGSVTGLLYEETSPQGAGGFLRRLLG